MDAINIATTFPFTMMPPLLNIADHFALDELMMKIDRTSLHVFRRAFAKVQLASTCVQPQSHIVPYT